MKLKHTGTIENERPLRLFKNEGKEKSLHQIFKAACHYAPGQGFS